MLSCQAKPAYFANPPPVTTKQHRLNEALREARQAAGLTQEEAAERLGKHPMTISRWERDKNPSRPSDEDLDRAADLYGTTAAALRYGEASIAPALEVRERPPAAADYRPQLKLRPKPYSRVHRYLEKMRNAGMPEDAIDEAERYLVEQNFGAMNTREYRERSDDEVIGDIDAMWAALKIRFERDWGVRL